MLAFCLCQSWILLISQNSGIDRWVVQEQRGVYELYAEFDPGTPALWMQLNDVQNELQSLLNIKPSGDKIQIMLFSSHARYLQYLNASIPEARQRRAIFFRNGDVFQIYAFRSRSLTTDLRHEFTHALLHQHLQFLPLWIDEGLAEYFEEPSAARLRSGRQSSVRWKTRLGWTPSLRELESIPAASDMTEDDYRDSWAWVSFLLNDSPETRRILADYLQVIAGGEAPGPFSRYLAERAPAAGNRLNSYFRKIQIPVSSTQE